jgi:hypothetical protein
MSSMNMRYENYPNAVFINVLIWTECLLVPITASLIGKLSLGRYWFSDGIHLVWLISAAIELSMALDRFTTFENSPWYIEF